MTFDEVQSLVSTLSAGNLAAINDHRIKLEQMIVSPQRISIIGRKVESDRLNDEILDVWLVGQEDNTNGYKIIMRGDGKQFGLASRSFPNDRHLVLVGWYGCLLSAFLAM